MRGNSIKALLILCCVAPSVLVAQIAVPLKIRSRPSAAAADDTPLKQPRVFWKSGEFIDGDLIGATDHSLSLASDIFTETVELQTAVLDRIEFPPATKDEVTGPFSILLKNGDRMFADITAATAAGLTLKNERHGELTVPLNLIQSVQRLKGGKVLYSGPTGAAGWKHYGLRDVQGFPWSAGLRGTLMTRVWNRATMLEMELPEKVELEIVVSSTGPLRFGLGFAQAAGSAQAMAVETWQDDLVVAQGNHFEPVLRLSDDDHSLALRLFWDRTANKLKVCDWEGKQLVEFTNDPMTAFKPCILVRNKGASLTVEHVSVRTWDGGAIATRDVKQGLVESMDGPPAQGNAQPSPDGEGLVVGAVTIPLDHLISYEAGPSAADAAKLDPLKKPLAQMLAPAPDQQSVSIRYADGTTLSGSLVSLANDSLQLKTSVSAQPINARLNGMTRMVMGDGTPDATPLDKLDSLYLGGTILHGQLEGTGDSRLRWRLPGAAQPAAVAKRVDVEVRRPASAGKPVPQAPALFFLKDGNVLGATLTSITPGEVQMHSAVAEVNKLEPAQLNAIHFNSRKVDSKGFGDSNWQIVKGTEKEVVRRGDDKVILAGVGAFGNPSVMAGDEVSFTMNMPSFFAALAVDLFVGDFEHRTKTSQLHLIYSGSDFWAVLETGENNSRSSEQLRNLTTKSIDIRMVFTENSVTMYANNLPLMNASLEQTARKGAGIIFSPSTMWGNPTREVEITNFQVRARADFVQVPVVSEETKRNALTIPRFRRNSVPTNVLLAPNGDVLRGVIESATATSIKFQSGLDHIEVPMDRVASAVWLDKPKEAPKPPPSEGQPAAQAAPAAPSADPSVLENFATTVASHWLILQDGSRLAVKIDKFEKDHIKAWAPTLGEVKIPNDQLAVLKLSAISPSSAMVAYQGWKPEFAAEPVLPETGGQSSPLLGKPAPDLALPLLGGGQFNLAAEKGKVIVLDFWATWCGPCVMSLPEQLKAMEGLDPNKVRFIAVNQGEPEAVVAKFLQTKGFKMEVAMDLQQVTGQKFGAESIPHCVVVGPDGKVIWVNSGYAPGESEKMAGVIKKVLGVP